jgi:hypothetical protein
LYGAGGTGWYPGWVNGEGHVGPVGPEDEGPGSSRGAEKSGPLIRQAYGGGGSPGPVAQELKNSGGAGGEGATSVAPNGWAVPTIWFRRSPAITW